MLAVGIHQGHPAVAVTVSVAEAGLYGAAIPQVAGEPEDQSPRLASHLGGAVATGVVHHHDLVLGTGIPDGLEHRRQAGFLIPCRDDQQTFHASPSHFRPQAN